LDKKKAEEKQREFEKAQRDADAKAASRDHSDTFQAEKKAATANRDAQEMATANKAVNGY
jgi:hypothetical protein